MTETSIVQGLWAMSYNVRARGLGHACRAISCRISQGLPLLSLPPCPSTHPTLLKFCRPTLYFPYPSFCLSPPSLPRAADNLWSKLLMAKYSLEATDDVGEKPLSWSYLVASSVQLAENDCISCNLLYSFTWHQQMKTVCRSGCPR